MAGLIQQRMEQPTEQPAAQRGSPNQQAVERVVIAATRIIHDPKVKPQLVELMKNAGDPVTALVEAVFLIMRQIMEKSGRSVPSEVLGTAAFTVLHLVGELAQAAGLFQVTPELIQQAAQAGLERLKQEAGPEQAQAQAAPTEPQPGMAPDSMPMNEGA